MAWLNPLLRIQIRPSSYYLKHSFVSEAGEIITAIKIIIITHWKIHIKHKSWNCQWSKLFLATATVYTYIYTVISEYIYMCVCDLMEADVINLDPPHENVQYGSLACCLLLMLCQYIVGVYRSKQCKQFSHKHLETLLTHRSRRCSLYPQSWHCTHKFVTNCCILHIV